ncbi:MAG: GNAT family N-acetyltransferase [Kordiimonas sp.]
MTHYVFTEATVEQTAEMQAIFHKQACAPLDGMWLSFAAMAEHYFIAENDVNIGYYAINNEQKLLQFYVEPSHDPKTVFQALLTSKTVRGAMVSTAEPEYLSLSLDHQASLSVNGLMYHFQDSAVIEKAIFPSGANFKLIIQEELETAIDFAHLALGADRNWLNGYYSDRIKGEELFGLWLNGALIAAGECRPSKEQPAYADVGMVVSPSYRAKGLATNILRKLIQISREKGLKPICSTEFENIGAQKSIARSGFVSHHRILDVKF